jgi:hypothetical protein
MGEAAEGERRGGWRESSLVGERSPGERGEAARGSEVELRRGLRWVEPWFLRMEEGCYRNFIL